MTRTARQIAPVIPLRDPDEDLVTDVAWVVARWGYEEVLAELQMHDESKEG